MKYRNLLSHIKVGKEIITLSVIKIKKHKFHRYKVSIFLEDVDAINVLASNKISSGEEKTINNADLYHFK